MNIPQEAVEAAEKKIVQAITGFVREHKTISSEELTKDAIAAALPHIEKAMRAQAAADIWEYWDACGDLIDGRDSARKAIDAIAAQIAEGADGKWMPLCRPCANRRLKNPLNALLGMRKTFAVLFVSDFMENELLPKVNRFCLQKKAEGWPEAKLKQYGEQVINETLAGIQEALNECGCDIRILSMRLDV